MRAENPLGTTGSRARRRTPASSRWGRSGACSGDARKVRRAAASKAPAAASGARPSEPLGELGVAFRHVFRALNRLRGRDTHLGGSELSHAQFELLVGLDERGELSAGELALAARLDARDASRRCSTRSPQSGHVERDRSHSDRRVVVSRLTPHGRREIAGQARGLAASAGSGRSKTSPEADLRAAARVLERLDGDVRGTGARAGLRAPRGAAPAQQAKRL